MMMLVSVFAFALRSECVYAKNVYIQKSEGGAGLDAWFDLENSEQLSLAMMDCQKTAENFVVKMDLFLCINEICEERTWEILRADLVPAFFYEPID